MSTRSWDHCEEQKNKGWSERPPWVAEGFRQTPKERLVAETCSLVSHRGCPSHLRDWGPGGGLQPAAHPSTADWLISDLPFHLGTLGVYANSRLERKGIV